MVSSVSAETGASNPGGDFDIGDQTSVSASGSSSSSSSGGGTSGRIGGGSTSGSLQNADKEEDSMERIDEEPEQPDGQQSFCIVM